MTCFGYDVSHWQGSFDHQRAYDEGLRFCYAKCTEGYSWRDSQWPANRDGAFDAGLHLAAYHFLRSDSIPSDQAANLAGYLGDERIPVVIDCEPGAGDSRPTPDHVRRFVEECAEHGIRCSLLYLPRWYWRELGSPDLTGLPPLIQSHYGENPAGHPAEIYPGDDSTRWDYDGHPVTILQFGSRGLVSGSQVDVNAYQGSADHLSTWFLPTEDNVRLNTVINPKAEPADQVTVARCLLDAHVLRSKLLPEWKDAIKAELAGTPNAAQIADRVLDRMRERLTG